MNQNEPVGVGIGSIQTTPFSSLAGSLFEVDMYEVWEAIPELEHYEASSLGRVRMLTHQEQAHNRWGKMTRTRPGKILRQSFRGHYLQCSVKNRPRTVHRLVAMAFHGLPPEGYATNHKNGVKTDNRPDNIEWVTNSENELHSHRILGKKVWNKSKRYLNVIGLATRKHNYLNKCRALLVEYETSECTQKQLADKYGLSRRTVCERLRAAREVV